MAGYYVTPFEFPSARPSTSYPISNWSISDGFSSLCMGIGIEDIWFGIANEQRSFINYRVKGLDSCKKMHFRSISLNKWKDFDKIMFWLC